MYTKRAALLCLMAATATAEQVPQLFKWEHKYDVPENITITVESVSEVRLHNLLVRYPGHHETPQAFSLLRSGRGIAWSCEIFIGPTKDRAGALAHELRHCHGWVHP